MLDILETLSYDKKAIEHTKDNRTKITLTFDDKTLIITEGSSLSLMDTIYTFFIDGHLISANYVINLEEFVEQFKEYLNTDL